MHVHTICACYITDYGMHVHTICKCSAVDRNLFAMLRGRRAEVLLHPFGRVVLTSGIVRIHGAMPLANK